jgi:hypothetical protein
MTITRVFDTEPAELYFVRFTENTPTSIGAELEDTWGSFRARIHREGEKFFANCDGMPKTIDGKGDRSSSLSSIVWEFDLWLHRIFEGAALSGTRVKWPELELEYWKYLKEHEPTYFVGIRTRYLASCKG